MTQPEYIAILFDDCGFEPPARRAWLRANYGRAFADELSARERHQVIGRLKSLRSNIDATAKARDNGTGFLAFDEA